MIAIGFPKPEKHKKVSKVEEWDRIREEEIKPQFEKWGIYGCEIGSKVCVKNYYLGFAHTKKRRNMTSPEDLRRVVLACQPCHSIVEYRCETTYNMSMTDFLESIIVTRMNRLKASNVT